MQGFIAQFVRAIQRAKIQKYLKPQDCMSGKKKFRINQILWGSQHTAKPNTIEMAIFSTLRSQFHALLSRVGRLLSWNRPCLELYIDDSVKYGYHD